MNDHIHDTLPPRLSLDELRAPAELEDEMLRASGDDLIRLAIRRTEDVRASVRTLADTLIEHIEADRIRVIAPWCPAWVPWVALTISCISLALSLAVTFPVSSETSWAKAEIRP